MQKKWLKRKQRRIYENGIRFSRTSCCPPTTPQHSKKSHSNFSVRHGSVCPPSLGQIPWLEIRNGFLSPLPQKRGYCSWTWCCCSVAVVLLYCSSAQENWGKGVFGSRQMRTGQCVVWATASVEYIQCEVTYIHPWRQLTDWPACLLSKSSNTCSVMHLFAPLLPPACYVSLLVSICVHLK